jgi:hypothetical protein
MNFDNDEEALGLFNRLLEQFHQAGINKIDNLVFVAPGAQYVNHIDTQIFGERQQQEDTLPAAPVKDTPLPPELSTPKAMALWQKAQAKGCVDANYQPLISRTQAALLADEMAKRLGIKDKWKVFEELWNRRNMYRDYHDALEQHQSLQFRDILKVMFQ